MASKLIFFKVCLLLFSTLKVCTSQNRPWFSDNDKIDSNFWSWGFADDTEFDEPLKQNVRQTTSTESAEEVETAEYDPCAPYDPPIPNFREGRRVSVAKCDEYIWGMTQKQIKSNRNAECKRQRSPLKGYGYGLGGQNALSGEFPHMGAIGWKAVRGTWKFGCAGSLISSKFVLTAAHCSRASSADTSIADPLPKIIRFGDKNIISKKTRQYPTYIVRIRLGIDKDIRVDENILRTIVHSQYKAPKKYFDIALMELEKGFFEFTDLIHPACLWGNMDTSSLGKQVTVTGWGVLTEDGVDISPELQAMDIVTVDTPLCNDLLRKRCNRLWCGVQDHQICAGNLTGGVDSCRGDSGGPMQVKLELPADTKGFMHYVVGITSFGVGCGRPNSPAIYTRVASFIDWIEDIVWRDE